MNENKVKPLSAEEIVIEKSRHSEYTTNGTPICDYCDEGWPCFLVRLITTLGQSIVDLETLQGANILNKNAIKFLRSTIEALEGSINSQNEALRIAQTTIEAQASEITQLRDNAIAQTSSWHKQCYEVERKDKVLRTLRDACHEQSHLEWHEARTIEEAAKFNDLVKLADEALREEVKS